MTPCVQQGNLVPQAKFDSSPTAHKGVQNIRGWIPGESPPNLSFPITRLKFYIAGEKVVLQQLTAKFLKSTVQVMPHIAQGFTGPLGNHTQLQSFEKMKLHRPSLLFIQTAQDRFQEIGRASCRERV